MIYHLGANTTANLESILKSGKPESLQLVNAVKEFIQHTPIDFTIIFNGGYRSAEQQKILYDKGKSKCDGYLTKSKHQCGLAVDLVPWVNGRATWEVKGAFYLSGAFMSFCKQMDLNITSGADWNKDGNIKDGWDPCHFQIRENK